MSNPLSDDLISQFAKAAVGNDKVKQDTVLLGTITRVVTGEGDEGVLCVKIDGSDIETPVSRFPSTIADFAEGDRVEVMLKNHALTITGNITNPAISTITKDNLSTTISQTAEEIRLEAADTAARLESSISVTASEIRSEVKSEVDGLNSTISQTASSLSSRISNNYGEFTELRQTVDGFTVTNADGTTTIDGSMIETGTIYADKVHLGGALTMYDGINSNVVGGYFGYCTGWNSTSGVGAMHTIETGQVICTDEAARLSYGGGSSFVATYSQAYIDGVTTIQFELGGVSKVVLNGDALRRSANSPNVTLGNASNPWAAVYADTGEVTTSDQNKKNSIESLPEKYLTMFDQIQPKRFKLNDGTSGRYHIGYIAQEVEAAMTAAGIDSQEFGGFVKDVDEDGNDIYLLRYGEFDAIRDAKIKQLEAKNKELEARIEALEKLLTQ